MSSVLDRKCPFKKAQISYQKAQTSFADIYTRVVQKVRGQSGFYHFIWVNIYIPYTKMFVVKFQFKIKWILIIFESLN
jgi:hypothetical protein